MNIMNKSDRIRFGGSESPAGFLFELTGGDPALDLANTVVDRAAEEPRELLQTYGDLVAWARQGGVIDARESRTLLRAANRDAGAARRALKRVLALRERLFALLGERDLGGDHLRALQELASSAARHRVLKTDGAKVWWEWEGRDLDGILWRVGHAAASLLTSERRDRVRMCAGDLCRWLFVDDSRRGNRRWCDMTVCGNRAKARRFQAKRRSA